MNKLQECEVIYLGYKDIICGIYVVTNTLNGKQYVGQSKNCKARFNDHKTKSVNPRKKDEFRKELYIDIRNFGVENFTFEVLEECDESLLKEREIYWIKKLDTYNNGYNNTKGGNLPCKEIEHHLEQHGKAKFTNKEVEMCRLAYKNGNTCREIYDKFFKDRTSFNSFQKMWHGKTWKEIMPEVFETNPHPKQKVTDEDIKNIRTLFDDGETVSNIVKMYKGKLGYGTIYDIAHRKRYV